MGEVEQAGDERAGPEYREDDPDRNVTRGCAAVVNAAPVRFVQETGEPSFWPEATSLVSVCVRWNARPELRSTTPSSPPGGCDPSASTKSVTATWYVPGGSPFFAPTST